MPATIATTTVTNPIGTTIQTNSTPIAANRSTMLAGVARVCASKRKPSVRRPRMVAPTTGAISASSTSPTATAPK